MTQGCGTARTQWDGKGTDVTQLAVIILLMMKNCMFATTKYRVLSATNGCLKGLRLAITAASRKTAFSDMKSLLGSLWKDIGVRNGNPINSLSDGQAH